MKKIINLSLAVLLIISVGCSQNGDGLSTAEMTFKEDLTYDFGKIKQFGDGTYEFEFKNSGKDPLVITNVKSSCGCTVPTYPREPIKKGQNEKIHVKYDTNRIGTFNKTITVYSNAKNSPVELRIKGEVYREQTSKN